MFSGNSVFLATGVAINTGTRTIRFPRVVHNEGNDYDPTTGVFTCRIPGSYWFSAALGNGVNVEDYLNCDIVVNNSSQIWLLYHLTNEHNNAEYVVSGSAGFYLAKGDIVQIGECYKQTAINIYNDYMTYFSGVLIRPDA